jgi:predicted HNH restriction endonuclease
MADQDWTPQECLLALWAYHCMDRDKTTVKKRLYEKVHELTGRTVKAVEYKVQNVADCDPRPHEDKPISPMPHVQQALRDLFPQWWPRRDELDEVVLEYESLLEQGFGQLAKSTSLPPRHVLIEEGAKVEYAGRRRQRSAKLAEFAREHYRKHSSDGFLHCAVCGVTYDDVGAVREILHVHHLEPIADLEDEGHVVALDIAVCQVRPVCPTCHSVIHLRKPLHSIEEARAMVEHALFRRRS